MIRIFFIGFVFLFSFSCLAQLDSIQQLEVINLKSNILKKHSKGYKVITLTDSIISKNNESFTNILRYNSPIYLRENGNGGVSSASFRGTSASNTAVIWNGININSINNGQTDFNGISVNLFGNLDIRSGGGSIEFGSGAIGGTVHLNNNLHFGDNLSNELILSVGSYETYKGLYKFSLSKNDIAINFGIAYNQSENDYEWLGYDLKNENGAYQNLDFNLNISKKINKYSKLSYNGSLYNGDREFSGQLPNPSAANEKYIDKSFKNLLTYDYHKNEFYHKLKFAYILDEYNYYENKESSNYNFGKSNRYIGKYEFKYIIGLNSSIEAFSEYESAIGETDQMNPHTRNQFSQSIIYNQRIKDIVSLNVKIRKDFNSDYDVPFVYAIGADINTSENIFIRVNGSKNYRVPSFNDLFWPALGNQNLIPENSIQGELGFGYKTSSFKADVGIFYIDSKDKIVWTPGGDPNKPGIWVPINIANVENKGFELVLSYNKNFKEHYINFNMNYSYTIVTDKDTEMQVPFVPKNLLNLSFGYSFKRVKFLYQHLFNDKIYTTTDNIDLFSLESFNVGNVGIDYNLIQNKESHLSLGVKLNNIFNEAYKIMPRRPMPNRNINFNINYKF